MYYYTYYYYWQRFKSRLQNWLNSTWILDGRCSPDFCRPRASTRLHTGTNQNGGSAAPYHVISNVSLSRKLIIMVERWYTRAHRRVASLDSRIR